MLSTMTATTVETVGPQVAPALAEDQAGQGIELLVPAWAAATRVLTPDFHGALPEFVTDRRVTPPAGRDSLLGSASAVASTGGPVGRHCELAVHEHAERDRCLVGRGSHDKVDVPRVEPEADASVGLDGDPGVAGDIPRARERPLVQLQTIRHDVRRRRVEPCTVRLREAAALAVAQVRLG